MGLRKSKKDPVGSCFGKEMTLFARSTGNLLFLMAIGTNGKILHVEVTAR